MGQKYYVKEDTPKKGMSPEQGSILVVMLGFLLIIAGIFLTKDILNMYFNIGILVVILGTCLYTLFIYSRLYSIEHVPIPIPDSIRNYLNSMYNQETGAGPQSISSPQRTPSVARTQPVYYQPRPTMITQTPVAATTPMASPEPNPQPPVTTSMFKDPQPVQTAPVQPQYPQPAPTPQPYVPTPVPQPAPTPSSSPYTGDSAKPEPKQEQFVDVLEEADKEFESYIDKLIEE